MKGMEDKGGTFVFYDSIKWALAASKHQHTYTCWVRFGLLLHHLGNYAVLPNVYTRISNHGAEWATSTSDHQAYRYVTLSGMP